MRAVAARGLISDDIKQAMQASRTSPHIHHLTPCSVTYSSVVVLQVNITVVSARAVVREPLGGAIYPSGNENGGCVAKKADAPNHIAAVVMITFNRPTYLRKAVESLLSVHHRDPGYRCLFTSKLSQPPSSSVRTWRAAAQYALACPVTTARAGCMAAHACL